MTISSDGRADLGRKAGTKCLERKRGIKIIYKILYKMSIKNIIGNGQLDFLLYVDIYVLSMYLLKKM